MTVVKMLFMGNEDYIGGDDDVAVGEIDDFEGGI